MKILMIGHLLGDFYFQTNQMAKNKKQSFAQTLLHCLIYFIVIYAMLAIGTGELVRWLIPVLLIGVSHLLIDGLKCLAYKKCNFGKNEMAIFIVDQCIHMSILWIISDLYFIDPNVGWLHEILGNTAVNINNVLSIIIAILICGKPASVIVALVFSLIPKTIKEAEEDANGVIGNKKKEEVKIGAWIGILEREIILILGLLGQYSAIGFVVAAKSLARHSQLNEPAFAEKYLIGTLLSTLMALACVVLCSIGK